MKVPNRSVTSISLQVDSSKEYNVSLTAKKEGSSLPLFNALGRGGINYDTGVRSMDMTEVLFNLSHNTNATWLMWLLIKHRNYKTNVARLEPKDFTDAEVGRIKRGRKELEDLNVKVRYKNNHYLFNPIAVLPAKENYMSVCAQWFEITGQDVNVSAFIPIGS
jgi:hypothetical protein